MTKSKKIKEALQIITHLLGDCQMHMTTSEKERKEDEKKYKKLNRIVKEL